MSTQNTHAIPIADDKADVLEALRVLDTGELERVGSSMTRRVDIRIIAPTNSDLNTAAAEGAFRQDLLYRLNTVHINLPPLRERPEDIPLLAEYFLARHRQRYRKPGLLFSLAAFDHMRGCRWPGNVRELDHAVEWAVLMPTAALLEAADLLLPSGQPGGVDLEDLSLEEVERMLIEKAIRKHDGNVSRPAKALGLSRSGLYRRMEKYEL